ncbi:signal recognition particle-docking protein FtsY [Kocuria sp. JC486]|uniref:Signal recognition particle receptor FtsY n=1 Tax=Kocuria soli TaxID=2485125 RepID=A0A3N3ZPZ7_9MICC|nr:MULTISPECIES: signal recognition particle-docking protein FtsY [Kocuria]NHU85780.1 signal recognition particle-docking protein FtsY [Kocuria sp. JC486]ROZ63158.1 signal recognition particle-docking protein FtsY [Kocuria soli]
MHVDQIPVYVYVIVAVVILALLGFVLLRGPKAPPGGYKSTRDPDDPIPGGAGGDGADGSTDSGAGGAGTTVKEAPSLDRPESVGSRMARLRGRLAKSNNVFGRGLLALLSRDRIDQDVWDEIEETLLLADLGSEASMDLVEALQRRVKVEGTQDPNHVKAMLREELLKLVDPTMDRSLAIDRKDMAPAVVLVVGVNGVGKTTTVGKLARVLVAEDKDVVLGAADTFRAAAADQLQTWGNRVGVVTVRSETEGADPASVAFDAVKTGIESESDVVLLDTAGRLQNKAGLMDQLGKIKRVVGKAADVDEVLLVIDATTGQNGMVQAKVFSEAVNVTGIVLTKLDGTAKGGIVVAIQRALGVPVKLIGLGEGPDDLAPFDAEQFVDALLD